MLVEMQQDFLEQRWLSHGHNFLKPLQKFDHFDPESGGVLREAYGSILKSYVLPHLQVKTAVRIQKLYQK